MAPPSLTPEQRQLAVQRAAHARRVRAQVRNRLKNSGTAVGDVIRQGQSDNGDGRVIGRMKVSALLESLPGVGPVRAQQAMERIGIATGRRVRGLGINQISALERAFGA
jgi:hypothetical protein